MMVRSKGRPKKEQRSLSQGEIADLKGQRQEIDATIKYQETNPGTKHGVDVGALKRQRAYFDKVLHDGSPVTPRGFNKDALAKEAKEIEDRIKVGMPTKAEMDHPGDHPGAIHKHMNWEKRNADDIRRYKEIQRKMEPQDPTATDIEKLRKKGD